MLRQIIERGGRAPYQIAVTICERCRRGWQDSGGTSAPMSLPMLERALCDAQHIGSILGGNIVRASQTIPPATRRMVQRRDRGKCRVPGCRSIHNLDVHHIRFLCDGGGHEMSNLITLCEGHHLALHAGTLIIDGDADSATFTRSVQSSFKTVARMVEAKRVLKERGLSVEQVRAAIETARTHVGNEDMTVDQWVRNVLVAKRLTARGVVNRRAARGEALRPTVLQNARRR